MKPGRNDPCPCGSGKKYKHCCADSDARAAPALRLLGSPTMQKVVDKTRVALRAGAVWEADVVPLHTAFESDPDARPVAVLLGTDGLVLHTDIVSHPPAEVEGVVEMIAAAIEKTTRAMGKGPGAIRVRHHEVADRLAARFANGQKIPVRTARELPALEEFTDGLLQHMGRFTEPPPRVSMPYTWTAWGMSSEALRALFSAAAVFYRTRPWAHLENEQFLRLDLPSGGTWTASVLGNAGEEFGLALYEDPDDLNCILAGDRPDIAFRAMKSAVLSLTFEKRSQLPKPMQREVARHGWEIADSAAYPVLWTLNTPGGGISRVQTDELIASLGAVARFAEQNVRRLTGPEASLPFGWRDDTEGVTINYMGRAEEELPLWPPLAVLTLSLPEGANADPQAVLRPGEDVDQADAHEQHVVERFAVYLGETATDKHVESDVANAQLFTECMTYNQGVRLGAVTEYDLRVFLYDWFARKVLQSRSSAMRIRSSLRRFFDYLAEHEGISYPWARAILRDRAHFELRWDTFPGGFWWDPAVRDWQNDLYADLDARVMLPSPALADIGEWGDTMGSEEAELHAELQRHWLVWRDEVIDDRTSEPAAARAELVVRQHQWERAPHAQHGKKSVSDTISAERARKPRP